MEENKRVYGYTKKQQGAAAAKILESYKQSEQYQQDKKVWEREFVDYVIYGKPLYYLNGELIDEIIAWPDTVVTNHKLTPIEMLERFDYLLTDEEKKKLNENI